VTLGERSHLAFLLTPHQSPTVLPPQRRRVIHARRPRHPQGSSARSWDPPPIVGSGRSGVNTTTALARRSRPFWPAPPRARGPFPLAARSPPRHWTRLAWRVGDLGSHPALRPLPSCYARDDPRRKTPRRHRGLRRSGRPRGQRWRCPRAPAHSRLTACVTT